MKFDFYRKIFVWMLSLILLLAGCHRIWEKRSTTAYRVITEVHVVYKNGPVETHRHFYQEGSIRVILEYLRHIDPYGIPRENPETAAGRDYHITLVYSDGSQRVYHQRADQYMRIDGGDWKRIDGQKALYLSGLLVMMPSEEVAEPDQPIPPLLCPQI